MPLKENFLCWQLKNVMSYCLPDIVFHISQINSIILSIRCKMNHLRYKTRYASRYEQCRGCYSVIPNGKVVMAVMIQVSEL